VGKRIQIEKAEIETVAEKRDVALLLDPDTGIISSGILGEAVQGHSRRKVFEKLQAVADAADRIRYITCFVTDPGMDLEPCRSVDIGVHACTASAGIHSGDVVQLRDMSDSGDGRVRVVALPPRWIIRSDRISDNEDVSRALDIVERAKSALADTTAALEHAESMLAGLVELNPTNLDAFLAPGHSHCVPDNVR
jgi:hypothetical protein